MPGQCKETSLGPLTGERERGNVCSEEKKEGHSSRRISMYEDWMSQRTQGNCGAFRGAGPLLFRVHVVGGGYEVGPEWLSLAMVV